MKIYVQSSGIAPGHEYVWLQENNTVSSPDFLNSIDNLREKNAPSIILGKRREKLFLLVTNLQTSSTDYQQRTIFASVAWIGTLKDETFFRIITSKFLREDQDLLAKIDQSIIQCESTPGFKIEWEKIRELYALYKENKKIFKPDNTNKIGSNTKKFKLELADELEKYYLPNIDGVIVVVTGAIQSKKLQDSRIWRSLSNLIVTDKWQEINEDLDISFSWDKLFSDNPFLILLAIIVAILTVGLYQLPVK